MLKVKTKNNNMAIVLFNTTNLLKEGHIYQQKKILNKY